MVVDFLYTVFIFPIEELMRFIMLASYQKTGSYGISIILLSLIINTLLLPIYFYADKLKLFEQMQVNRLKPKLEEIKKVYAGRERYFLIRTLYRQHSYHPVMAMRVVVGLLIQIPFFFAAFLFLKGYSDLLGESFLIFSDLSSSDGLLTVFGHSVNVMPFVMTAVNLISLYFYSGNLDKKELVQLLLLPALFLVLLYSESLALVLYWTLNNIFSIFRQLLFKSKLEKLKEPEKKSSAFLRVLPAFSLSLMIFLINPLLVYFSSPDRLGALDLHWVTYCFWTAILVVVLIHFLSKRFVNIVRLCVNFLAILVFTYSYIITIDYGLFRGDSFSNEDKIYQLASSYWWFELSAFILLLFVVSKVDKFKPTIIPIFLACTLLALLADVSFKADKHYARMNKVATTEIKKKPALENAELLQNLKFSSNNKNIILIVPDAGAGYVLDSLFRSKSLSDDFDGFVFYKNAVAEGTFTMSNAAALIGGKSFSPEAINKKNNQTLHAHMQSSFTSLLEILSAKNVENIIINPAWVGCDELSNFSYCGSSRIEKETLRSRYQFSPDLAFDKRTLLSFSLFKMSPLFLKPYIYGSEYWDRSLNGKSQLDATVNDRYPDFLYLRSLPDKSFVEKTDTHQFIHIWSTLLVAPFTLSKDCGVVKLEKSSMYSKASRKNSTHCVMSALSDWFEWMKEEGVYDNTKIIIAADHGAEDYGASWYKGAVNPILLVKDFGSKGLMKESDLLMQNSDVLGFICSGLDGCEGVVDPVATSNADRKATYSVTTHGNREFLEKSKVYKIKETFEIKGHVYDDERFKLKERSEYHDAL